MRMRCFPVFLMFVVCSLIPALIPDATAQAPQAPTDNGRKLVRRVDPAYPEMAKRVNLTGTVKVYAVVGPDGTVKSVEPVGGSPLLVQASEDAIKKWKFVPAAAESKELIELHFHPE
jgi:TonB family protein